jgi:hypothetical protein
LRRFAERKENWALWIAFVNGDKKKLRCLVSVGLVLVVGIFVLTSVLGKQKTIQDMQDKLALAEENVTQAQTQGAFDKAKASDLLDEAEALAVAVLDSGYAGGEASQLLDEIKDERNALDNVQVVSSEVRLVADLTDKLAGVPLIGVETYGDRIVAYTAQSAYQILLDQVEAPDTLDAADKVTAGEYFDDYDSIVMATAGGNLIEYTDGNTQFADTSDVDWHTGVGLATYSNKIYLLDPTSNQIWRYQRGTDGYGSAQGYFSGEMDLSKAVSLAVDGSVWILNSDGSLLKYLSGTLVDYGVKKPSTQWKGLPRFILSRGMSQLCARPGDSRFFIYDKSSKNDDITYNAQYVFEDLKGTLVDFYVDKDRNVINLVTTQALYELSFN